MQQLFKHISEKKTVLFHLNKKEMNNIISVMGGSIFLVFTLYLFIFGLFHGVAFNFDYSKIWIPNLIGSILAFLTFWINQRGKINIASSLILYIVPVMLASACAFWWGDSTGSVYYLFFCSVLGLYYLQRIRTKIAYLLFNLGLFMFCVISFRTGWFKDYWYMDRFNLVTVTYCLNMLSIFLLLFLLIFYARLQSALAIEEYKLSQLELAAQNDLIKIRNLEIKAQGEKLADSIKAAYDIQHLLFPQDEYLKTIFPQHFVFFKPLDFVSGDFYWAKTLGRYKLIAAADCTGHGVSGAFMSILGISLLEKIFSVQQGYYKSIPSFMLHPNLLLNQLQSEVKQILKTETVATEKHFGMEIALCLIEENELLNGRVLHFSGANSSLYYFQNNQLNVLKGNKFHIGNHTENQNFDEQVIVLEQGDVFYLFSDGYKDQFGIFSRENQDPRESRLLSKRFKTIFEQIHPLDMSEQKVALGQYLSEWQQDCPQTDDILIIGIRI